MREPGGCTWPRTTRSGSAGFSRSGRPAGSTSRHPTATPTGGATASTRREGWAKYNKYYWLEGDYDDFVRFFFSELFTEPHSTKQIEDCVAWAHEIAPSTLADTTAGRLGVDGAVCERIEPFCERVQCPVLVIHGTDDHIRPHSYGERLAELTGGELLLVEGSGHGIMSRDPVLFNEELRRFVDRIHPPTVPPRTRSRVRAPSRPRRALYLSSPIGLGHARRDVAIAGELRRLHPDLQVDWLAQHPVTRVLADAGETLHPASRWLVNESSHIESECGEHDLNAFQAIRRMDAILVNNFGVFRDVLDEEPYDLVVADEAWDVDYFLHENPQVKRAPLAWMTDFVGWLPMPEGGSAEAALTADYNAEMIEQRARFRAVRDRSVFVGNESDVVDASFGPGLPLIRDWTSENFDYAGYVTGFEPTPPEARSALRSALGYHPDERVCVVTVGGSGVGGALLRRVLDAVPLVRAAARDVRFVVVTGPRIDPESLPSVPGVEVRGFLPDLVDHLAVCDVAVVQGGLSTTMELHREPATVRLRAVATALRAEPPRAAPPRGVRRRDLSRVRRGERPGRPGRRDPDRAGPRRRLQTGGDRRRRPSRRPHRLAPLADSCSEPRRIPARDPHEPMFSQLTIPEGAAPDPGTDPLVNNSARDDLFTPDVRNVG